MSDDLERMKDDISFMKGLARDDGRVLLASGLGLVIGGVVFGLMVLRSTLMSHGWLDWPEFLRPLIPFDAVVLFFAAFIAIGARWRVRADFQRLTVGATSRAMWASWAAVGIGYLAGQTGLSMGGSSDLAGIVLFAFWGNGWFVVWAIYRQPWLLVVAVGCYATAIAAGMLWHTLYGDLLLALAFWTLVALPGVFVVKHARSRT